MRDQEEAFLRKQMNPRKAKEIAEQKYRVIIFSNDFYLFITLIRNQMLNLFISLQERLQELELRLHEEEVAERMNIEHKKAVIIDAFNRQEEQLDDSKLVSILNFFCLCV